MLDDQDDEDGLGDIEVDVDVDVEVATLTRANLIGHTVREIAAAARATEVSMKHILQGFQERLMQEIKLMLRDGAGEVVGFLSVRVDWERHAVLLTKGSERSFFTVDLDRPLTGQVAPLLDRAKEYIAEKKKEIGATRTELFITYRPGKQSEGNARFHTSPVTQQVADQIQRAQTGAHLEVRDHNLSERSLLFRHRLPPAEDPGPIGGSPPG